MQESERYSLALTAQPAAGKKEKKTSEYHELQGEKQAALYQERNKSPRPDVATVRCCQKAATLTDTQQSSVIPKTCGSCKNNPTPPHPLHEPLPQSSHTAHSAGARDVFFPEGVPHEYDVFLSKNLCLSVCTSKTETVHYSGVKDHNTMTGIDLDVTRE